MVIDAQNEKLTMTVLGETVQLKAADSVLYPFATFPNQCSFVDCYYLCMSNPSFQGKNRADLEAMYSKDKWKRRQRKK